MVTVYYLKKKYKEAIPYLKKSFEAIKDLSFYSLSNVSTYKKISTCFKETGDYKQALIYHKLGANMADSITRKTTELSMKF